MSMPALAPQKISQTCKVCFTERSALPGDRLPPCKCADLPLSEKTPIVTYQRAGDEPGHEWFAIAMPGGCRPVRAFASTEDGAVSQVKRLLDV